MNPVRQKATVKRTPGDGTERPPPACCFTVLIAADCLPPGADGALTFARPLNAGTINSPPQGFKPCLRCKEGLDVSLADSNKALREVPDSRAFRRACDGKTAEGRSAKPEREMGACARPFPFFSAVFHWESKPPGRSLASATCHDSGPA